MVSHDLSAEDSKPQESSLGIPSRIRKKLPGMARGGTTVDELCGALMVVGKHALLFDDDDAAGFINSPGSLLPWNGDATLMLDRYDVRHLLQDLSSLRCRHARPASPHALLEDLNYERYRDLDAAGHQETEDEENLKRQKTSVGAYQSVAFSYDAAYVSQNPSTKVEIAAYYPPFLVPKELEAYLPHSQKVHQIIAGTAKFVCEHGGQSEIILRVKQANNPTFGFLMPDNRLHVYFRYLVEHSDLMGDVLRAPEKSVVSLDKTSEGLSILGDTYGDDDDEDGDTGMVNHITQTPDASEVPLPIGEQQGSSSVDSLKQNAIQAKCALSSNEEAAIFSEDRAISNETGLAANASPISCHSGSLQSELREEATDVYEVGISEPPPPGTEVSQLPTANNLGLDVNVSTVSLAFPTFHQTLSQMTKMVKSASCNMEFEAAEAQTDEGRDDIKQMEKDMKSKAVKSPEAFVQVQSNVSRPKSTILKSKFSGSLSKSRQVEPGKLLESKTSGVIDSRVGPGISSDAAAAVVRAATRGPLQFSLIRKVVKDIEVRGQQSGKEHDQQPCGMSLDAAAEAVMAATQGHWKERKKAITRRVEHNKLVDLGASMDKLNNSIGASDCPDGKEHSSDWTDERMLGGFCHNSHSLYQDSPLNQEGTISKIVAKAAAAAVAYEADSADAQLTPEEKRKAERLKRAKIFAAMIQSGSKGSAGLEFRADSNAVSTSLNLDQSDQPTGSYGPQTTLSTKRSSENMSRVGNELKCSNAVQKYEALKSVPLEMTSGSSREKSNRGTDKRHRHRRHHRHHHRHHHHDDSRHRRNRSHSVDEREDNEGQSLIDDTDSIERKDQKDRGYTSREAKETEEYEPPVRGDYADTSLHQSTSGNKKWEAEDAVPLNAEKLKSGPDIDRRAHTESLSVEHHGMEKQNPNEGKASLLEQVSISHTLDRIDRVEEHQKKKENVKRRRSDGVKYRKKDNTSPDTVVDTSAQKKRAMHGARTCWKHEDTEDCPHKHGSSNCKSFGIETSNKHGDLVKEEPLVAAVATTDISDDLRAKVRAMLLQIQ